MHTSLDVMGILLEPADALNAVLYLMEKDWGMQHCPGLVCFPLWVNSLEKQEREQKVPAESSRCHEAEPE